jgi:hypothetical protein
MSYFPPVCPSAYYISKITQRISIKFGIDSLHYKLSGKFGVCW